jgi:hypothetical protein
MKTKESLLSALLQLSITSGITFLTLLMFSSICASQLYLEPNPISSTFEKDLLLRLKRNIPANQRLKVLLDLGNLYYNDPLRTLDDFEHGFKRAAEAIDLSKKLGDESAFNAAQYIKASILMLKEDKTGVDEVLKIVNDSTKIKIQLACVKWYVYCSSTSSSQSLAAGTVWICLTESMRKITLELSDDGIGMPSNIDQTELDSLGLELMKGLTKDIKGDINFEVTGGTKITIQFSRDEINQSENLLHYMATKDQYI